MEIMVTSNEMQTRSDQRMRCGINVAVDKMLRDVESEIHVSNLWFHVCTASFIQRKNCLHVTTARYNRIRNQKYICSVGHSLPSDAASSPSHNGERARFHEGCYGIIFVLDY